MSQAAELFKSKLKLAEDLLVSREEDLKSKDMEIKRLKELASAPRKENPVPAALPEAPSAAAVEYEKKLEAMSKKLKAEEEMARKFKVLRLTYIHHACLVK